MCECQQHKAELACLRQIKTGSQSDACRRSQQTRQCGDHYQLEQDGQQDQHKHQRPVIHDFVPVQQHADTDEKKSQQYIVKRPDIGFHLMLVLGF